jgi:hypothetical protein
MERKRVCACQIKENIFIQGYAQTTVGLYSLDGPVFATQGPDVIQLGQNMLDALEEAGKIIPHPTQEQWKEMDKNDPFLKAAKMKTWNVMMKAAKSVSIELYDKKITITPSRFGGTRGDTKGYHDLDDKAIICTDFSPEILGRALLQAFDLCE